MSFAAGVCFPNVLVLTLALKRWISVQEKKSGDNLFPLNPYSQSKNNLSLSPSGPVFPVLSLTVTQLRSKEERIGHLPKQLSSPASTAHFLLFQKLEDDFPASVISKDATAGSQRAEVIVWTGLRSA